MSGNGSEDNSRINRFNGLVNQPAAPVVSPRASAPQQPGTSQGPSSQQDFNTLFYYMMWAMLYDGEQYATPDAFDHGVDQLMLGFDPEDPANEALKPLIDVFKELMTSDLVEHSPHLRTQEDVLPSRETVTNPPTLQELRGISRGEIPDALTRTLPIAPEVRASTDPKFNEALRQAAAYGNRALPSDPKSWTLVEKIVDAQREARSHNLDADLFVAQIRKESTFKNNAYSSEGAAGIAQIIAPTWLEIVRKHGKEMGVGELASHIDRHGNVTDPTIRKQILDLRYNPSIAIEGMAAHMQDLTKRTGDQRLALIAYNGGWGAIQSLERNLGQNFTFEQALAHWRDERAEKGAGPSNLWRNQTYDYGLKIASNAGSIEQVRIGAEGAIASAAPARQPVTTVASTLTPAGVGGS